MSDGKEQKPGDGIRSMRSTGVFRLINFELYTKPNMVVMGLGLTAITGVFGYIAYMRYKYQSLGYYVAVKEDGKEEFIKKKSNWEL
ncbi:GL25326 [Drosophila persimilis]|uniref:Small integral membrane protein 8 n=2 Tax=pseudoobscura subgroup TaxID=32358 RepID=Q2M040_DROPS|nr:small integral membrane protein 8 [Drosophila pseudoobscura]XP_002021435.1 small integral membrane protein 8 [Drosophila persimilis]XP_017137927.1 small integral membrane protein 8 [Drosophila miranda]EDW40591.1 GL25326 [Drosophila persimilis]